ncbi:hypothetical protein BG000_010351 [Podila horticola]|nr:hypothetical protein BG000_010351 [Podila horticola]
MFDTGQDYDLLAMDAIDPNDIATLLKLYLRELLSYLCHHLSKIAAHSDTTKMTVSNLGVVFAPTLSIGSVLFKALLGGFYDGVDTPENREKGLKIVWGGLLQDLEFGIPDYDDEEAQEDEYRDKSATPISRTSAHKEEYYDESDNISHETSAPTILTQGEKGAPSPDPEIPDTPTPTSDYTPGQNTHPLRSESPKEDEDRLMSAMMRQEEKAVKGEPTDYQSSSVVLTSTSSISTSTSYSRVPSSSPPSHSTSTANMPLFSTTATASAVATGTSAFDASRPRDHTYFQDQATSSTSRHGLHISIGAGSSTSGSLDSCQSPTKSQETPRSASGAPQLPPLEGEYSGIRKTQVIVYLSTILGKTQPTPSRAIDLGRQITSLVFIITASRISGSSKLHATPRTTSWSIPDRTNDTDHIGIQDSLHSDD